MKESNKKAVKVVQVILGLILIFFGLNGFFQFMAMPEMNQNAQAFIGALFSSGYIFPIINVLFLIVGLLFIFNKCASFATVLLFPISVNIILFHIFLDIAGSIPGLIVFLLNVYLLYAHFDSYRPMCK